MIDINDLITNGYGDIQITVTANDLMAFANHIIASLQNDTVSTETEDESMTRQQVMDYLGVKSTTLWNWEKKKLLVPRKIGRKYYYSKADLIALQRGEIPLHDC